MKYRRAAISLILKHGVNTFFHSENGCRCDVVGDYAKLLRLEFAQTTASGERLIKDQRPMTDAKKRYETLKKKL